MAILAKNNGGGDFELTPAGNQQAVCVFVEDIGTHEGSWQGKPIMRHQIVLCWELAEAMTKGENAGKPFMVSKFYTLSLSDRATLRKDLESWRGKAFTEDDLKNGFDVEKLKGVNCLLNIVHEEKNGNTRARVASISPLLKNMAPIKPVNTRPPEWIQKLRNESIEAKEQSGSGEYEQMYNQTDEESLPF